jgi:hypothetical protein
MGKPSERERLRERTQFLEQENRRLYKLNEDIIAEGNSVLQEERKLNAVLIYCIRYGFGNYFLEAWDRKKNWKPAFGETCCEAVVRLLVSWTPEQR